MYCRGYFRAFICGFDPASSGLEAGLATSPCDAEPSGDDRVFEDADPLDLECDGIPVLEPLP